MRLYPAIDLKDGVCVRLLRGEMTTATSFNDDPADQALRFAAMGFEALHVVDLNGAFEGHSVNHNAVSSILDVMRAPVQLGGGIRDMAGVERWLDAGVSRVILGTAAVRDPDFVKEAARAFPGTSPSASMRATDALPCRVGRRPPTCARWTLPRRSKAAAWRRSS